MSANSETPELSNNAKNVLSLLLLYAAREYYPESFGQQVAGELVPFLEYIASNDANGRNVFRGFAELWDFAGLER